MASKKVGSNPLFVDMVNYISQGLLSDDLRPVAPPSVSLPPKAIDYVASLSVADDGSYRWSPNPPKKGGVPNTQQLAYDSPADVIGLSGTAGWGKSDLLLGLAINKHRKSVILRRSFANIGSIVDRSREIYDKYTRGGHSMKYNGSLHRWKINGGRQIIEFESCQLEAHKEKQRGRARDFYAFDEAPQFTRSQCEFISGWNRSPDKKQHCQVVYAFNVPTDDAGGWVIDMFLPWIAYRFPQKFTHPNPAKEGELRWYATVDGKEVEFENGEPITHKEEQIFPRSRTFFFGTLEDNPYYGEDYIAQLQSQPEPMRSQLLYGNFAAEATGNEWQVIPTAWIRAAMRRWVETEKPNVPLSGVGVDVARGGNDKTTICKRYGAYFDVIISYPGAVTFDGPVVAQKVIESLMREDGTGEVPEYINVDVIGVGSSPYDCLKDVYEGVVPVNFGSGTDYRDKSGTYKMKNKRAEIYWRMREALDPANGHDICLPDDNELLADLASATYIPTVSGLQIESKADIKKRLGRSPDKSESAILANYFQERWLFA